MEGQSTGSTRPTRPAASRSTKIRRSASNRPFTVCGPKRPGRRRRSSRPGNAAGHRHPAPQPSGCRPSANPTAKCRAPTGPPASGRHANIRECDDVSEVPTNRRRLAGRPTAAGKAGDGDPTRNHDNRIPERRHAPSPSGKPATHGTPSQPRFGTFRSGEPPSRYRIPRKTEGHNKNSNHE